MKKPKKYKYYWESNTKILSGGYAHYTDRRKSRKEQRTQLWIDFVVWFISIPPQNILLYLCYKQHMKKKWQNRNRETCCCD